MSQSPTPKASFSLFAASLFLLQFLLPWLALCSKRPYAAIDTKDIQLTRDYLDAFTLHLTGGLADPHSVRIPADLFAETFNEELWTKYIIGSVAVLGSVDECALSAIRGFQGATRTSYLSELSEQLVKKNDCDTVVHFIVRHAGEYFWDTDFGRFIAKLMDSNWDAMHPLLERVLAVLRESRDKSNEYGCILKRLPIEFQYEMISSGQVTLDDVDRVYLSDKPPHSLLREIFFQARYSPTLSPAIREYIAERVPWLKQFLSDAPNEFKDTAVTSIVEPGHDVWTRICSFMDAETLILVWPSVCRTWNKSYSKMLAEDTRIQEWFLQDLSHVRWYRIHTIAPWKYFLNGNNSGLYLGQCIISGAIGRAELDRRSDWEIGEYLRDVIKGKALIPQAEKNGATHESFAKLFEKCYETYRYEMPILLKPPFLTDEEYERVIHYLVCQKKLVVKIDNRWIIANIPRIYSMLGEDQGLIRKVIELSTCDYQAPSIWIMIGQVCGITEETAKSVFNKRGTFIEQFIRPVVIKPSGYYDHIAESGMLFEMVKAHYEHNAHRTPWFPCPTYQLSDLMISLILFFKNKPDKIEKIVASMASQLPTLHGRQDASMKTWLGTETMKLLADNSKYSPEDVESVKVVMRRCGLLDELAK